MGKLVELTSTSFSKAHIITTRLEASGIECYFKSVFNEQVSLGVTVKIFVYETELEKAFFLLKDLNTEILLDSDGIVNIETFSGLIIVPIDFSEAALNACYYALEIANKFNSRIKLIHTYGLPEIRPMSFDDTDFYTGTLTTHLNELKKEAEANVDLLLKNLKEYCTKHGFNNIPIHVNIVNGLPDEITLYTAEEDMASLIVIGVSKKDVRTFEPMGKIASRIVEKASCPALIIPEDCAITENLFQNILYTTAYDEMDFAAIQKLLNMVKRLKSKIYLLHISSEEGDPWDKIKMEGLREYFAKAYSYKDVVCNLTYSDDMLKTLDEFIQKNSINIISMTTHKRNLISRLISPSLTQKVLYHTKIPILVFHS
jgi:nucleotide-binding universal stress UspA family protein